MGGLHCRICAAEGGYLRYMARHGRVPFVGRGLMVALVAAGGLAGCGRDEPKTTTAATGSAATAPAEPASTTASSAACTFSGATDAAKGGGDAPTRLLTDVRVGAHGCYDRVTFELKPQKGEADGPVSWKAAYESAPITEDGSGRPVRMKGTAFLVVTMSATGADLSQEAAPATYTGPTSIEAAEATRIQQVRRTGDFEGVLTWVIGLDKKRPFHVSTQDAPARVIVDVGD
ncbi:MAG: AMIN-like domain-containing (lipo)protein [Acidimicrobiia bacterium]